VGASSDIGNNFYLLISMLGRKCEGYTAHHLINKNNNLNALRNDLSRFAKYQLVEGSNHQFIKCDSFNQGLRFRTNRIRAPRVTKE
jgi:hypothetical protein